MKNLRQFATFLFVGLVNTGLTLSIIFIFRQWLETPLLLANICGYGAGFINSFFMNRRITFSANGTMRREVPRYILVYLICYGLQLAALYLFTQRLALREDISTIIAMIFFTIPNYFGNKYITFKNTP